jgi:polyvinyl alcohol dehydrogenase (cytochrome)
MTRVEDHPMVRGTGAVTVYDGKVFVPMTGISEAMGGANPDYACCTFRGSMTALDAATGKVLWKTYTIPESKPRGTSSNGKPLFGPAGVGIWNAPTVDAARGVIYSGTGPAYAGDEPETTDAVLAFNRETGAIVWTNRFTLDVWIAGCDGREATNPNCPKQNGPDIDFSASPILTKNSAGRDVIVIPQKSGMVYALDPAERGKTLWSYRAGPGGPVGGVWGSAVEGDRMYVAVGGYRNEVTGGLHAIDIDTGERVWYTPPQPLLCSPAGGACSQTQSAAVTAVPGAVFSGSADGGLRAYDARDGKVIWTFDANREFETINGVAARGASFDGPGPVVAGGMLYVLSGNAGFVGRPGNVLLAFAVE